MRGSSLNTTARGRNKTFNRSGIEGTSELLLLGLDTRNDRDSKEFLVHAAVQVEDLPDFLISLGLGKVSSMALLPQELPSTEERF
jgi:hypothetical protein